MIDIREGDVYTADPQLDLRSPMRRVLGILGGKVVYSRGGGCQWDLQRAGVQAMV